MSYKIVVYEIKTCNNTILFLFFFFCFFYLNDYALLDCGNRYPFGTSSLILLARFAKYTFKVG